jgi:hypothetical protein
MGRFYCDGLTRQQEMEVENKITELCKTDNIGSW